MVDDFKIGEVNSPPPPPVNKGLKGHLLILEFPGAGSIWLLVRSFSQIFCSQIKISGNGKKQVKFDPGISIYELKNSIF